LQNLLASVYPVEENMAEDAGEGESGPGAGGSTGRETRRGPELFCRSSWTSSLRTRTRQTQNNRLDHERLATPGAREGGVTVSQFTEIMQAIEGGDPLAPDKLLPLVYDELRKLAAAQLANEQPGQTLQPTALVHEAYLRLVGGRNPQLWNSRRHFFAAAAVAIRRILIDTARRKRSLKRGGQFVRKEIGEDIPICLPEPQEDLLALDEALQKLATAHPQAAELVQLLYFAALTLPEAAQILDISPRTAGRLWTYARAWLRREIEGAGKDS
jgi:RNA polymerase sigma factor (TIGR02999 family)